MILKFNQFNRIFEAAEKDKFFSFLGGYVDTDHHRTVRKWDNPKSFKKMQKYQNKKDNRFLNLLRFIYDGGDQGRASSEIIAVLKSWGLSGGGNILYASEWDYDSEIGSRRTGIFKAHCTKINGKWFVTDNRLNMYFYLQDMVNQGATEEDIEGVLNMSSIGIDLTRSSDSNLDDLDLKELDI
jgi:hypothetical protein